MTTADKQIEQPVSARPIAARDPQGAPAPVAVAGNDSVGPVDVKAAHRQMAGDVVTASTRNGVGGASASKAFWLTAGELLLGPTPSQRAVLASVQQKGIWDVAGPIVTGSLGD
jgi:hypothetical protein